MKRNNKFIAVLIGSILSMSHYEGIAQEMVLIAENLNTHEQVLIPTGKIIRYRIKTADDFEKGTVTEFTDSSISIENKSLHHVVLMKDLAAIKVQVPRSTGRKIVGYTFIAISAIMVFSAIAAPKDDLSQGASVFGVVGIGIPSFIIGRSLLKPKRLSLKKSWKLRLINSTDFRL